MDDAMARAVDIGENEVSLIVVSALAFILCVLYLFHSFLEVVASYSSFGCCESDIILFWEYL